MIGLSAYDPEQEDELVQKTARQRKEVRDYLQREEKVEFELRSTTIKEYFTRMSWQEKRRFLKKLYGRVGSLENLMTAITFISSAQGKLAVYSDATANPLFAYDNILMDHDRMLDRNTLEQTIEKDLDWLCSLEESRQIQIGIDLLRMGGGGLIRKMYLPLIRIYNCKIIEQGMFRDPRESGTHDLWNIDYEDSSYYDPNHPASVEVNKQRKKWDDIITKYRSELGLGAKEEEGKKKGKGKKEKAKKGDKKQKGKKGGGSDEIDWFQLLPIFIVKRTFSYLDSKSLSKLSKVNTYWAFAASGVTKERQTRKMLDSAITKLKSDITLGESEEEKDNISVTKHVESPQTKRINSLLTRGAILKNMIPKIKKGQLSDKSLITKEIQSGSNEDLIEGKLKSFPRMIREDAILYSRTPCSLKELGYASDTYKSKAYLMESFSGHMSSISFETATPDDW